MDNANNFEQQFSQNVKAAAVAPVPTANSEGSSKLPLVVAIALAAVTLVESIVLIITLSNYFALTNYTEDEYYESEEVYNESTADAYVYDDDYNLAAVGITCTAENGATITLDTTNKYSGSSLGSGTYTITNDSLISLQGSNKVLYYDGVDLADGLTIYTCEEVTSESSEE